MLNSASGVILPGTSTAPPMMTTRPVLRRASASRRTASARFVNGPRAMSVNRSAWARARVTSVSAAVGERRVARDHRQRQDVELRGAPGKQQRQGVVDAGISIEDRRNQRPLLLSA